MRVLIDHNVSEHLKALLPGHEVHAARDRRWDGWDRLRNGALILAAEAESIQVMVTGDKGIYYQQNNEKRRIALVVLSTTKWRFIAGGADKILVAVERATPAGYEYVDLHTA